MSELKSFLGTKLAMHLEEIFSYMEHGLSAEDVWIELGGDETDDVTVDMVQKKLDNLVDAKILETDGELYRPGDNFENREDLA